MYLHMRYMAKDGGATKAEAATLAVRNELETAQSSTPPIVLLSLKSAFPTAWHRFLHPESPLAVTDHLLNFELLNKHYPYFSSLFKNRTIVAAEVGILLKEAPIANEDYTVDSTTITVNAEELYAVSAITLPAADVGNVSLNFSTSNSSVDKIDDVFLILKYSVDNL